MTQNQFDKTDVSTINDDYQGGVYKSKSSKSRSLLIKLESIPLKSLSDKQVFYGWICIIAKNCSMNWFNLITFHCEYWKRIIM